MDYILSYLKELSSLTNEMTPYLIFGFLFAGILHVYVPKHKLNNYMGKNNLRSVIYAAIFGVPLPLCSCGVVPVGISFYKNGVSKGGTISFLISTPQTGLDSIFVTYSLLGLPFAILRPVIAFFSGIFGGMLTNIFDKNSITNSSVTQTIDNSDGLKKNRLLETLDYAFVELLDSIAKWLVIGLLVAAFISLIIPDGFFSSYLKNDFLSMLLILVAAVPLYVCATGSVPIAAVLLMKGLSPGAALVFLMAGPATNIATMTIIGKVMGKKSLYTYLISIILSAFFFGFLINEFVPREWLLNTIPGFHSSHLSHHLLPLWLKKASTILLMVLIFYSFLKKYFPFLNMKKDTINSLNNNNNMIKNYTVKGMTCSHCVSNVENNLKKIEGIVNVKANLNSSQVSIEGEGINEEQIKLKIEEIGYEYGGKIN